LPLSTPLHERYSGHRFLSMLDRPASTPRFFRRRTECQKTET
jgi:hypothetical protein